MTIQQIIDDKSIKRLEKRTAIVQGILDGRFDFSAVSEACSFLPEKKISLLLEAIEEVSRSKEVVLEERYRKLSESYLLSSDPSCKREASRIVGNLAAAYPEDLDDAITALLQNADSDGTVIRWASAYALSRIVLLPHYAKGPLFEQISNLYEKEKENGVRNQYGKALKKAEKLR
ncbi:MAG: HEAT repeat domain-containing protein [Gemmiger sp.]|uniref:HEAT repeat domain-containing protein n=1 Tax=Gemmiger sp. TaxID=2049027 RepID=UPI002E77DD2E|nr:HEAT repeat domain-containing protein [Gemmiger sp.]MEE0800355.1 HEAT repeat domain-containing protein [Gemmiger sp.]